MVSVQNWKIERKEKVKKEAMFIKDHLYYERLNIASTSYENLTFKILSLAKDKIVSGIYRPPKHKENDFFAAFVNIHSQYKDEQ